jgi:hypothetical protein
VDVLATPTPLANVLGVETVTPDVTPTPAIIQDAGELGLCNGRQDVICVVAIGVDNFNGDTSFSLNVPDPDQSDLYLFVWSPFGSRYACQTVRTTPGLLYCSGDPIPEGTQVTVEVFETLTDQKLVSGAFVIPTSQADGTPATSEPSYPSYPSYP